MKCNAEMCEMLGEQCVSAYSIPVRNVDLPSDDNVYESQGTLALAEIQATTEDLMASIVELPPNSLV